MKYLAWVFLILLTGCLIQEKPASQSQELLTIQPIAHASVMFNYGGLVVYVDPASYQGAADFSKMFKADIILITHHHFDHLDTKAINYILKEDTLIIGPRTILRKITYARVIRNGDVLEVGDVKIKAVPAYNYMQRRGVEYHPKGRDNGYILTFGSTRVYVAGDTECVPEIKALKGIDIAFLPIDGVDTMTPEEAAECVKAFKPKVVYPYHQGSSNPRYFASLLKGEPVEVRVFDLP